MEKSIPMDRLLCGDVGFGKTEVAFVAAFKAILDSKQVLFLCPTTILSSQHFENAKKRFKNFPVSIGLLNRFSSPKQVKEVLSGLENGTIDIVFGTHRLLSKDVEFKNLGAVVVDEQHRLLDAARNSPRNIMFAIVFTLYTGCRKGETLGLQWKDVDFDENKIHVGQQLNRHYDVDGDGEQRSVLEVTTPKTKQSVRDIYVCDSFAKEFYEYKQKMIQWKKQNRFVHSEEDFVFVGVKNTPIEPRVFFKYYKEVLEEAKGHTSSGSATCSQYEYCTECGEKIAEPKHTFENGVCLVCNELESTDGLELEVDFDGEYYYVVTGIETSASYVVIPNTYNGLPVKEISASAFEGDQLLEKVYIPKNIEYIGDKAFYNCPNLTTIFFEGTTKPGIVGANWNGSALSRYKGEYSLSGNVATSTVEDTQANLAYDLYISCLETIKNNYTLAFNHKLDVDVLMQGLSQNMDFEGSVDMKASGDTRYAQEVLKTSDGSETYTDKTTEYYNDGYLYSYVSMISGMTQNQKTYCTLPITQFIHENLTVDVVTPTRADFSKAVMVDNGDGTYSIVLSTGNGYTAAEIGSFINFDKVALNMDISGILAFPNASATVRFTMNSTKTSLSVELEMSGSMNEAGQNYSMSYTNTSYYTSIGSTPKQTCPNPEDYLLHNHNGDTNTCEEVVCGLCKNVIQEAKEHTFETQDCESNKCTVCGEVVETGKQHIYSEGECIYCGKTKATENLGFELSYDETYYILESIGSCGSKNIIIPATYNGLPVKQISSGAFNGSLLESLYIPSSVTSFGYNILGDCDSLKSVTFENIDSITQTFSSIFGETNVREVVILGGTTIYENMFYNLESLEVVVLPNSLERIRNYAFTNCVNLKEITLPNSLNRIDRNAFEGCSSLVELVIPASVTEIDYNAFVDLTSLKELTVNIDLYTSYSFSGMENLEVITLLGNGEIANDLFSDYKNLKEVNLSDSITKIGQFAFEGCTSLTSINIPSSVIEIGKNAFSGCTSLTTVTFASDATIAEIPERAFEGCVNLTSINIPSSVKKIGTYAFSGDVLLEEVLFDDNSLLETINSYAFANCTSLEAAILFEGVKSVGSNAFANCVFGEVTVPSTITYIDNDAFVGCQIKKVYFNTDKLIVMGFGTNQIEEIVYNSTVIKANSLNGMDSVKKVVIGDSVKTIQYSAFANCPNLSEVVIGNGVETIGYMAFQNCTSLASIVLPNSLLSLDHMIFKGCTNLTEIYYDGTINDWLKLDLVEGSNYLTTPAADCEKLYIKDENGEYYDLKAVTELEISDDAMTVGQGQLHMLNLEKISLPSLEEGKLVNYFDSLNQEIPTSLKEVVIRGGEEIYDDAFDYCSDVKAITLPNTLTQIDSYIFQECDNLEKITVPFIGLNLDESRTLQYLFGSGSYYIPSTLADVVVTNATSIAKEAFYNLINVKSVDLSACTNLTSILDKTFYNCSSLTSVLLPTGLESIGSSAFEKCTSLKEITIPETVTSVGDYAFNGCTLLETVKLPEDVTTLSNAMFYNCTSLKEITILEGVETIGGSAFKNCTSLTSITLPKSLKTIESSAFEGCSALVNVYYNGTLLDWANIDISSNPMEAASHFYIKNENTYEEVTKIENLDGITSLGWQFEGFDEVTEIVLPTSLTSVSNNAFAGCNKVVKITTPIDKGYGGYFYNMFGTVPTTLKEVELIGLTTISSDVFKNCSTIEKITIPNTVLSIGNNAFNGCSAVENLYYNGTLADWLNIEFTNEYQNPSKYISNIYMLGNEGYELLTEINIPETVTKVGDYAFIGFTGIKTVSIPASVKSIGNYAFSGCTSLTSVTMQEGLESIGKNAFYSCNLLENIVVPTSVTSIGSNAFGGCALTSITLPFVGNEKEGTSYTHFGYIFGAYGYTSNSSSVPSSLKTVVITSATNIPSYAFYGCSNLTSITLPSNVTSIGDYAFYNCSNITKFELPEGLESIGANAFANCSNLESINTPANITSIGASAFENCSKLASVKLPKGISIINTKTFYNCSSLTSVVIPANVESIGNQAFYGCSLLETVEFEEESKLTSIGNQAFYNCSLLEDIVVPANVTSIGSSAFNGCKSLTSITLPFIGGEKDGTSNTHFGYIFGAYNYNNNKTYVPSSLTTVVIENATTIPSYAFYQCGSIWSISIPENITSIGDYAFNNCYSLTSIEIPAGVESIGVYAFYGCNLIEEVEFALDGNLKSIGNNAFYHLMSITSLTIPSSVEFIGSNAFNGCNALETLTFAEGSNLTSISDYAFAECKKLTTLEIPESVETIGERAFYNCSGLTNISFGAGLTSSKSYAFNNCTSLETVYYNGTLDDWCNITFADSYANPLFYQGKFYILDENGTVEYNGNKYGTITELVLSDDVTTIGQNQFYNFGELTNVVLPKSLTSVGSNAFTNCIITNMYYNGTISDFLSFTFNYSSANFMTYAPNFYMLDENGTVEYNGRKYSPLTEVEIPETVTTIGQYAFYNCQTITSVKIPASVESIGNQAFYGCGSLVTVEIAEQSKLTSIGSYAFYECYKLTSITIPSGVKTIGEKAFYNCSKLESINIPATVETIYSNAFYGCRALTKVEFAEGSTLKNIGNSAFAQCTALTSIVIPNSVTKMGSAVFFGCNALQTVTLSTSITNIYSDTFSGCGLTSIVIPEGVTSIDDRAFFTCDSMTEIVIPSSVKSIGYSAFNGCMVLQNVYYTGSEAMWKSITMSSNNTVLNTATKTYNYVLQ